MLDHNLDLIFMIFITCGVLLKNVIITIYNLLFDMLCFSIRKVEENRAEKHLLR